MVNKEAGKAKTKSKEAPQINAYLDKIRKRLWECHGYAGDTDPLLPPQCSTK